MSMQSLLVSNNYVSTKEALFCNGTYETALARALRQFCDAVVASRAALRHELREMPELRRGVPSQQYPMFGTAWPYIRSRHWHYRKTKQRDYTPRPLDCGDGVAVWSQAGKRFAKRVNNKRRRAEDKREIAREMDLWAQDGLTDTRLDYLEVMVYFSADGNYWNRPQGAGNVFVPPHPECFAGQCTYGNVPVRTESAFDPRNFYKD